MTVSSFRTSFPAFANAVTYADDTVSVWLAVALRLVNVERWQELADIGVGLCLAHFLALEAQANKAASRGGVPGGQVGILSSKSAGGVSAGYDVSTATEKDAGHWNMTTYGTRFIRLSRMMGAGPLQVGTGIAELQAFQQAYSGPYTMPSPSTP